MGSVVMKNSDDIDKSIHNMAQYIISNTIDAELIRIIGIRTRGIHIANRLAVIINDLISVKPPIGIVDITLYRDDFRVKTEWPEVRTTKIPFSIEDTNVILVDDVLFTGRTSRAALEAIGDYGRPKSIKLAVLVDRGHRELPIQADYVGMTIETQRAQRVNVLLKEIDGKDEVVVTEE